MTNLTGIGIWIWQLSQCEGGNVDSIIRKCIDNGVSYVILKAWDGDSWVHGNFDTNLVTKFHDNGIKIYAWGYCYGGSTLEQEIRLATVCIKNVGVDGIVLDVEVEIQNSPQDGINLVQRIRNNIGDAFMGYSSFGYPSYHAQFPWATFEQNCDAHLPQVYFNEWAKSPSDGLNWAYGSWRTMNLNKPIFPAMPSWNTSGYTMDYGKIKETLEVTKGYGGINFWSWQHMTQEMWNAIHDNKDLYPDGHYHKIEPVPTPAPEQPPTQPPTPVPSEPPVITPEPTPTPVPEPVDDFVVGTTDDKGKDEVIYSGHDMNAAELSYDSTLQILKSGSKLYYVKNNILIKTFLKPMEPKPIDPMPAPVPNPVPDMTPKPFDWRKFAERKFLLPIVFAVFVYLNKQLNLGLSTSDINDVALAGAAFILTEGAADSVKVWGGVKTLIEAEKNKKLN